MNDDLIEPWLEPWQVRKVLVELGLNRADPVPEPEPEESDQAFTIMPKACTRWECQVSGLDRTLKKNPKGFMVCPVCGGSYGKP